VRLPRRHDALWKQHEPHVLPGRAGMPLRLPAGVVVGDRDRMWVRDDVGVRDIDLRRPRQSVQLDR